MHTQEERKEKEEKEKLKRHDFGAETVKRKRQVQELERLVSPFHRFWDGEVEKLSHLRLVMSDSDKVSFDALLKDFKKSGESLYTFLRELRLRMQKGK